MEPARVFALGDGLHEADGVSLIPMSAKLDLRKGSDATILIFRRGTIDAALMDANPKLKLIQRIGARADAHRSGRRRSSAAFWCRACRARRCSSPPSTRSC